MPRSRWRAGICPILPCRQLHDSNQPVVHPLLFWKPLQSDADYLVRATEIQKVRQQQSLGFQLPLSLLTKPRQTKALMKLVWSLSWIASVQIELLLQTDR